ncbi:MAG: bifunctional diaminohydroxyphosphoribosylaminopyrimidine deaminase/5-amino-6-(5-phosphoribosylamino)uracil reductase RibD [Proteobacteria bacterium]|nr:bifunctional diaminohydroxyphosphoribosylaminopyrimidine deaminase/5-amino-6-(5-phosphoribosylamino)uracil reductase RibD [Pseudomonadota bacterium]
MRTIDARSPKRSDDDYLGVALALAGRGLGNVWPNPAVGCVLVRPGRGGIGDLIAGRGWTQPGGRPHAETMALEQAGPRAKGATAYVSLEPCAHHGETPPCAEALIAAEIARVVVAAPDPDSRVNGRGAEMLRAAGVRVDWVDQTAGELLNAGYLSKVRQGRPLVTLKLASTLDGRIALGNGQSQWITGPQARARGHLLRAEHDAILIGIGTALADDPELTCRLPGMMGQSPVRVVLDSQLRLPRASRLARSAKNYPLWLIAGRGRKNNAMDKLGVEILSAPLDGRGRINLRAALMALAERGITRLLVEGGSAVTTAFLAAGLVDHLAWFRAPGLIGREGLAVVGELGVTDLASMPRFQSQGIEILGDDVLESYVHQA